MAKMTDDELQAFFQTDVLCRLGCNDESDHPYVVPCWFHFADGGFYIIPRERSLWASYIERDPRVSLCIDQDDGRRALIRGRAELLEKPNVGGDWVGIARKMAYRYRGEAGLAYLEASINEPRWLFFVRPISIKSWSGGGWSAKYRHSDW